MKQLFYRTVEQAGWANALLIDHLEGLKGVPEKAMKLMSHIVAAEHIWLTRLNGLDSSDLQVWPLYDLPECRRIAEQNREGYRRYLDQIDEKDLGKAVSYRNQTGKSYETAVADILTHVAIHGGYHRGQIAIVLREAGLEPVNTDFITFARL